MQASVQYGDFVGTAAADISDAISTHHGGDTLESIGRYLGLDAKRFEIIGISIFGTEDFFVSLLCVDKTESTPDNEHIVSMSYDIETRPIELWQLFKRLDIVLHSRFDTKYPSLDYKREVRFSDYHGVDADENDS